MGKTNKKLTVKQKQEQNKKMKEIMRKRREAIRYDTELYSEYKRKERERYHRRKAEGKIKLIAEIKSERTKKAIRKNWRERTKKHRGLKKLSKDLDIHLEENTPPDSPGSVDDMHVNAELVLDNQKNNTSDDKRKISAKKRSRENRNELKNKISKLQELVKKAENKAQKYKQRLRRALSKCRKQSDSNDTPNTKVNKILIHSKAKTVDPLVRRKLLFGEALSAQIKENLRMETNLNRKRRIVSALTGKIIKKYRCLEHIKRLSSQRLTENNEKFPDQRWQNHYKKMFDLKKTVERFLSGDESSRLCPGKRDTVTKNKCKMQKRFLNDTLKNLYHTFSKQFPAVSVTYPTFCKLRPFWIISPDVKNRNTCMCILHENVSLLIKKLKNLEMIEERSYEDIINRLCCENQNERCMERKCDKCILKKLNLKNFDPEDTINYEKWSTKREKVVVKGKEKLCQKIGKETITCSKSELLNALETSLPKFMSHCSNIRHQYTISKSVKENLSQDEVLIHIDFSENYQCKYASEIQSAHFGGSKAQITMHTGVIYFRQETENKNISFCTLSDDLRHSPPAICAHLMPVLEKARSLIPSLKTAHFMSDGPATQYRNRKMFHLIGTFLTKHLPEVASILWHFSEAGHGKGAPDGIGGYLKRTADKLVALGNDIHNLQTMITLLEKNCPSVSLFIIESSCISEIEKLIPQQIPCFKGTMKAHQITWSKNKPSVLSVRRLSCEECLPEEKCSHYDLGRIHLHIEEPCILFLQKKLI